MKEFEILKGTWVKLDDEMIEIVSRYRWRMVKPLLNQSKIVFETLIRDNNGKLVHIRLHRLVMGNPPKELTVIFRNNNRQDMQKSNLCLVKNHTAWKKIQNRFKPFEDISPSVE